MTQFHLIGFGEEEEREERFPLNSQNLEMENFWAVVPALYKRGSFELFSFLVDVVILRNIFLGFCLFRKESVKNMNDLCGS